MPNYVETIPKESSGKYRFSICELPHAESDAMTLMRFFVRHVGYRLYLAYQGESGILSDYRQSLPLWTADRELLAARKLAALKAMLIHAGATSPYYRDVFQRVGFDPNAVTSLSDLAALPFITEG